jgi:hypothetical protein
MWKLEILSRYGLKKIKVITKKNRFFRLWNKSYGHNPIGIIDTIEIIWNFLRWFKRKVRI